MNSSTKSKSQEISQLIQISGTEFIVGLIALIILSARAALEVFQRNFFISQELQKYENSIAQFVEKLGTIEVINDSIGIIIWGLVGLVVYVLCWSLAVIIKDMLNDVLVANYFIHPKSFHKSTFWLASVSRRLMIVVFFIVATTYFLILIGATSLIYSSLLYILSKSPSNYYEGVLVALFLIFVWFAGWHLLVIIKRITQIINQKIG